MTYKVWQVRCSVCFLGWGWSPVYSKKQGTDGGRRQSLWKSSKENPVKMCYNTIEPQITAMEEMNMENSKRKWLVSGWPQGLPLREEFRMRQGYISVHPTVRIREEALTGGDTQYILCFKSAGTLARGGDLAPHRPGAVPPAGTKIIAKPLIGKLRRSYALGETHLLEVNRVNQGQPTEFWYAEVEFDTVEDARHSDPRIGGWKSISARKLRTSRARAWGLIGKRPGAEVCGLRYTEGRQRESFAVLLLLNGVFHWGCAC